MENKKIDSIGFAKTINQKTVPAKRVFVDSIVRIRRKKADAAWLKAKLWVARRFSLPVLASLVLVFFSFSGGAYLVWRTDASLAQDGVSSANQTPAIPVLPVVAGASALGPIAQIPNEILFNLTLDQLEVYLAEEFKTSEMEDAERLADRKFKLKIYLDEKQSPLISIADTLAELKHWKMVLAISNSESTLGKRCYNNNCSGIGVEPGHPYWRDYESKADWAKDLDKLIEKRYKDWTLEEMNGVYNKPGSQNWLYASKQILEEMQERGIE